MMHLRILHAASGEPGLVNLPIEMIATIFEDMTESDILIRISKIVKNGAAQRHEDYVSQAAEVGRRADDDTVGPQNPPKALQCDVPRYRQVLYNLDEKGEVEFIGKRSLGFA
jgi:hypothetical protein